MDDIWDYTIERWGAAQAADYVRTLDKACQDVASGTRVSTSIDDIRSGYRKLLVQSHVIFWRQNEAGDTEVVRILHGRMDVPRHLPRAE